MEEEGGVAGSKTEHSSVYGHPISSERNWYYINQIP